jgi:hypothetical protein
MACLLINKDYAIIDCPTCRGSGSFFVIPTRETGDQMPARQDTCGLCKGVGLVRVPLDDIPIVNLGSDYLEENLEVFKDE